MVAEKYGGAFEAGERKDNQVEGQRGGGLVWMHERAGVSEVRRQTCGGLGGGSWISQEEDFISTQSFMLLGCLVWEIRSSPVAANVR